MDTKMAESSHLMFLARDLLATPSHEGLSYVVDQLFKPKETHESQSAQALYKFCVTNFSNCLTLMLLKVYLHSSDDLVRFRAICVLSETLTGLRNRNLELSLVALNVIKPLLVSCLTMPEAKKPDTKILRRIVSCVARNVVKLDRHGWDELGDCMVILVDTDPLRAFNIFLDLPLLGDGFINRFLKELVDVIDEELLTRDNEEDWTLALETSVKLGIQLSNSETGFDLAREIIVTVIKSAEKLVMHGKEQFLKRGLAHLVKFLAQDANMCRYSKNQCGFVSEFAFKISGVGTHTKEAARKIYQIVTKLENYVCNQRFKLSDSAVENQGFNHDLYNKLKTLSAVEILKMVASTTTDDMSREIAVGRLHDLLCDHTSNRVEIDVSEMIQIKKLLMYCLTEVGVPENTFKLLGKVVFHVALDLLSYQEDNWSELWEYIASECKSQFQRTVYIFKCLTMMVDDKEHVLPAVKNLLPEIKRRLINSPGELLVDNSCWVLAFVGGFCAAIHLIESDIDSVDEMVDVMVDSVGELVERGMEVGLVRRAFRDVESIVKKQVEWYDGDEYRLVKDLLWILYEIKGLGMESRMVLWRINVFLEKGTPNVDKEFAESPTQKHQ